MTDAIREHFRSADDLYVLWSPQRHMHHGYARWNNTLNRESMLDAMVDVVADRLEVHAGELVVDLGCGFGTTARRLARTRDVRVHGATICEEQVAYAESNPAPGVRIALEDYRQTSVPGGSADGAFALESICYGEGGGKRDVIREAARVLRPGARWVVADGFVLREPGTWLGALMRRVGSGWAVKEFPRWSEFVEALETEGFTDIEFERASFRIAPSVFQGQFLALWQVLRAGTWSPGERAHLISAVQGLWLGMCLHVFQYRIVVATREGGTSAGPNRLEERPT